MYIDSFSSTSFLRL